MRPGEHLSAAIERAAASAVEAPWRARQLLRRQHRVPLFCLVTYVATLAFSAVRPRSLGVWVLENLIAVFLVPALVLTYHRFRFSDRAYLQGLAFLLLHTVGSHYTYSVVPLGDWLRDGLNLSRNHYDRLVHFSFGLLCFLPLRELLFRTERPQRFGAELLFTLGVVALIGIGYEVIEWISALVVEPSGGNAFLGMQGDRWDAQKDLLLNCLGGAIAGAIDWLEVRRHRPARLRWRAI